MSPFREASRPYFTDIGLIRIRPGEGSANGILFLAEWLELASSLDELTPADKEIATHALSACEVVPGLYRRVNQGAWPWTDLEQQDDYIGVGAIATLCGAPELAREVLDYGRPNWWVMNNVNPGSLVGGDGKLSLAPWLGRYPAMIAHLEFAAGLNPPLWRKLWWSFTVAFSGDAASLDPWKLSYLMVRTMAGQSVLCSFAAAIFHLRMIRLKGSMQAIYSDYFGPSHPIALYCSY